MTIKHPIKKGKKVQYLSPKCQCAGGGYRILDGVITGIVAKKGQYIYTITTSRHRIPDKGIVKVYELK